MNQAICLVYMPVLHQGYLNFLARAQNDHGCTQLCLPSLELCSTVAGQERDLAVDPAVFLPALRPLFNGKVCIADTPEAFHRISREPVLANKHVVVETLVKQFSLTDVTWDTTFLRWDMPRALSPHPEGTYETTLDPSAQRYMQRAQAIAQESGDSFRQVGAVIVRDGQVLAEACNTHLPFPDAPYYHGDPACWREAGKNLDISTAFHAEQHAISQVRDLQGADIYVTTFPCLTCANWIALSSIRRCFYADGYSSLGGADVLKAYGIEIIKVITP